MVEPCAFPWLRSTAIVCGCRSLTPAAAWRLSRLNDCSSRSPQPPAGPAWDFQFSIKLFVIIVVQSTCAAGWGKERLFRLGFLLLSRCRDQFPFGNWHF